MTNFEKLITKEYNDSGVLPLSLSVGKKNYNRVKIATARGYQKVNELTVIPYSGRYGKGFTVDYNNPNSTYFKTRAYYIESSM